MSKFKVLFLCLALSACASSSENTDEQFNDEEVKQEQIQEPVIEEKEEKKVDLKDISVVNVPDKTDIYFARGKSKISKKEMEKVNQWVEYAKDLKIGTFVITGYCDKFGTKKLNNKLGLQRARAVEKHFKEAGVKNIKVVSVGKSKYKIFKKKNKKLNNALNRRVEITYEG